MNITTIRKAVEELQRRGEPVSVRKVHQRTGGSFRDILTILKILNVTKEVSMTGNGTPALRIEESAPQLVSGPTQLASADILIADAEKAARTIRGTLRARELELETEQRAAMQAEAEGNVEALTTHLNRINALELIIDRLRPQVRKAEDEIRNCQTVRDQLLKRSREIPEMIERLRRKWENPIGISLDLMRLQGQVRALEAEREADAKQIETLEDERLKLVGDLKSGRKVVSETHTDLLTPHP